MIEAENVDITRWHVINQQLFSEVYLQELRTGKFSVSSVSACYQTIREWREEYLDLNDQDTLRLYVGQCLSTLGFSYVPTSDGFTLYIDETQEQPVSFCLLVNDINLGRTTKGHHYQAQTINQLRHNLLRWGMMTNGKSWRLCYTDASAPYEVYLQIDLDALLSESHFIGHTLFYLFFGA